METLVKIGGYLLLILAYVLVAVLGITVTAPSFPEFQEVWVIDNNVRNWAVIVVAALLLAAVGNFILKIVYSKLKHLKSINIHSSKDLGLYVEIKEILNFNNIELSYSEYEHTIELYVENRDYKKTKKLLQKSLEYKKEV